MGGGKGLALLLNVSSILQYTWISRSYASARFHSIVCNSFSSTVDVVGQLTAPPPTCSGDSITFTCTVTGDMSGVTTWRVGGSTECHLVHRSSPSSICGPDNVFTAKVGTGLSLSLL